MNFEPSDEQRMIAESLARFLDVESSPSRIRAAMPLGFDEALWRGIAEMGVFALRVPEADGGLGLGVIDAALLMEEVGRTLASGPIGEAIVAARVLAVAGERDLLEAVLAGRTVVTIALHDATSQPVQWVAGGAVAQHVIVRDGDSIHLVTPTEAERHGEPNLASLPTAEVSLGPSADRRALSPGAALAFAEGVEEWKLLTAAALAGLSRQAIRLAAAYASEREQFGQPIGTYQGISHPLAELFCQVEGGRFFVWKTIRDLADDVPTAAAQISLALWWNAQAAARVVSQGLQTFGGYGLTTEYDIHLYNLRAKAWPLILGDPARLLAEAARRLYGGEQAAVPAPGHVSIDFEMGEQAEALAAEVRDFFETVLTPELRAKAHYSFDGHDPGVHRKLAEAGLLFPSWPKEFGGRGASPYESSAARSVWEEYGWTGHAAGTTQMVGAIIRRFGSDELKRDVLDRIVAGEVICSLGFSEPGSGSDVFAAKTRATPDGNGWRIDGQKMFTSGANIADYVLMITRTNTEVAKHKGLTMFVVPLKAEGVTIQPVYTFQDERTNITYYDAVRIPDGYRLGDVDGGVRVLAASLEMEHGASWYRTQSHMLQSAEEFCRETRRDGRTMIEDPAVTARLAKVFAGNVVTQLIGLHALWAGVAGKPNEGQGSMSKLFSSERFLEDARDLLDLTAPDSLSKRDGPAAFINLSYRHAHGTRIYGGTSEIHRSVVAERALKLPRTRA